MSEMIATPRDIFGWTVGTAITAGVTGAIGWFTGSFPVVWGFVASHALEAGLWTALFFLIGVVLGMLIRGHFAKKRIAELEKRPTREDVDELKGQLRAKDAEIAALRSAKVPTPLDMLKTRLGEDGVSAFRALCAASTYVDGVPARPLVFDLDDGKLKSIGLTAGKLRHMADVGAIRLAEADERKLIGTNACQKLVDLGEGVSGSSDKVEFRLADNEAIEVKPVHLNYGTDFLIVENNLSGADFGIASFTKEGAVLAAECGARKPPFGMDAYLEESYSVERRTSRHHFCYLSEDGKLVTP